MLILNLQIKNMKKILAVILFLSGISFAQTGINHNLLQLQNSIKTQTNSEKPAYNNMSILYGGKKKNTGVAVLLSLLLPGMGELYAEDYSTGKYFTIAEASLWGVYIGMNSYSNMLKSNYKSYAASVGGVNNNNKNADFYANVGGYLSSSEYNNAMALQGNFDLMYTSNRDYWNWPTTTDRKNYRKLWTSGEQTHNNLRFVVGALILNRIISAIDAVRMVAAYNKSISSETSWNVSVGIQNFETRPSQVNFNFQTNF